MAKGKFVQQIIEMAEKAGLDMSDSARMQRAKEQGFDTSTPYYHGTDAEFDEFDVTKGGQNFGDQASKEGIFLQSTKEGADYYGDNVKTVFSRAKTKKIDAESLLKDEYDYLKRRGEFDGDFQEFIDQMAEGDPYGFYERGQLLSDIREAKKEGFEAIEIDFGGIASQMSGRAQKFRVEFDPKNLRDPSAAFDPSKKESPNLLAGAIPAAVGLGSLFAGTEQAQAMPSPDLSARAALQFAPQSQGSIQAPTNERAALAAALAGQYNQIRRDSLHPLLDALIPLGELPEDLWRKRAYGDDVNMRDYINAGIGMF